MTKAAPGDPVWTPPPEEVFERLAMVPFRLVDHDKVMSGDIVAFTSPCGELTELYRVKGLSRHERNAGPTRFDLVSITNSERTVRVDDRDRLRVVGSVPT